MSHEHGTFSHLLGLSSEHEKGLQVSLQNDLTRLHSSLKKARALSTAATSTSLIPPLSCGFSRLLAEKIRKVQDCLIQMVEHVKLLIEERTLHASYGTTSVGIDPASFRRALQKSGVYGYQELEVHIVVDATPICVGVPAEQDSQAPLALPVSVL